MGKMTSKAPILWRLPGWIATGAMIAFSSLWTIWGAGEMYHEGWWGAWTNRLPYLVPVVVTVVPTLVAVTWPIVGGAILMVLGLGLVAFFGLDNPLLGGVMVLIGGLFLADGLIKRRRGHTPDASAPWWRRCLPQLMAVGLPLAVFAAMSVNMLPVVLTRVDDGDRSARLIEGNGVTLVWAPQGPGWNWKQPWGGYPSWQALALYGVEPVGMGDKPGYGRQGEAYIYAGDEEMATANLCRYLSADGTVLMDQPQDIWRLPTTDELVRSLVRHGQNAGCQWNGEIRQQAECQIKPDKESPLWATDQPAVYYWTADSHGDSRGVFVSYNGMVNAAHKPGGNPRHSYRCVRDS